MVQVPMAGGAINDQGFEGAVGKTMEKPMDPMGKH
jgi:hypothetical protein